MKFQGHKDFSNGIQSSSNKKFLPCLFVNKHTHFRREVILMSKKSSQQHLINELEKIFPELTEEEFKLFNALMNHKDENFLLSRRIQFTLGSLINQVYEEANTENYKKLIGRVVRLADEYITYQNKEGEIRMHSLFTPFEIVSGGAFKFEEVVVTGYISQIVFEFYKRM